MRWLLVAALVVSCAPAAAAPIATEDPRVADLTQQVQTLTTDLDAARRPTFSMWNYTQTILKGHVLVLGLPDTFTAHIRFTANAPVRARIMHLGQYVQYIGGGASEGIVYPAATSLDVTFHDAEGCATYVLVLDAATDVTVTPHIDITYAPAPSLTGYCAQ